MSTRRSSVLSHGLWQRRFGGDPGVLGRTDAIDRAPHEIIGVMGPAFEPAYVESQFWTPRCAPRTSTRSRLSGRSEESMRTIGLIGGTSWVSTVEYYRIINSEIGARRGGQSSARILLYSVDFGEIDALHARGDFEGVGSLLADAAGKLASIGAECILLCANTTHMHAERVQAAVPVPLIHLVEATAREVRRSGIDRVGLLGTRLTMERDFYAKRLKAAGIDVLLPDQDEREFVHRTIHEELVKSVFLPGSRDGFLAIIHGLAARGAQGIVLGCTEIPLLVAPSQSPLPAFDTTRIHALAAVDFALSV